MHKEGEKVQEATFGGVISDGRGEDRSFG